MVHAAAWISFAWFTPQRACGGAHILDHSLTHTINQSINQSEEASTHSFTLTVKFAVLAALAWMDTHSPVKIDTRHALDHSKRARMYASLPHCMSSNMTTHSPSIHAIT